MKSLYTFAKATAIVFCLCSMASSAELSTENQAKLIKSVDLYASRMSEVALKIWSAPELGYQETQTSALLQDELKKAGFKIRALVAMVARGTDFDGVPLTRICLSLISRSSGLASSWLAAILKS